MTGISATYFVGHPTKVERKSINTILQSKELHPQWLHVCDCAHLLLFWPTRWQWQQITNAFPACDIDTCSLPSWSHFPIPLPAVIPCSQTHTALGSSRSPQPQRSPIQGEGGARWTRIATSGRVCVPGQSAVRQMVICAHSGRRWVFVSCPSSRVVVVCFCTAWLMIVELRSANLFFRKNFVAPCLFRSPYKLC